MLVKEEEEDLLCGGKTRCRRNWLSNWRQLAHKRNDCKWPTVLQDEVLEILTCAKLNLDKGLKVFRKVKRSSGSALIYNVKK